MKVWISYSLPEDEEEYKEAKQAKDMSCALYDIYNYLRTQWKYAEEPDDIDKIYEKFYEILGENNLNLDSLF